MRKSYFAEFEIVHPTRQSITVMGPQFNNEIEAEQNLHYLQKKFKACIDSASGEYGLDPIRQQHPKRVKSNLARHL